MTGSLLYTTNPKTKEEVILPRFELESDIKKLVSYSKEGNFQLHLPFLLLQIKLKAKQYQVRWQPTYGMIDFHMDNYTWQAQELPILHA